MNSHSSWVGRLDADAHGDQLWSAAPLSRWQILGDMAGLDSEPPYARLRLHADKTLPVQIYAVRPWVRECKVRY
jgi:hypothetical protein